MQRYKKIPLYEMSNLFPDDTNVPYYTIWITTQSGREKHNARIKIDNADGSAEIAIWGEPFIKSKSGKIITSGKKFKKLLQWITLNREALLRHWSGETSSVQFSKEIKKVN
jgi:hypothetical protein